MNKQQKQYVDELSFLYGGKSDYRKITPKAKDKVLDKLLFVNLNDKKVVEKELQKILLRRSR
jgi:hypothetical protein